MGYIFDPDELHEISRKGVGLPHAEMCRVVIEALVQTYGSHIEPRQDWLFNLASGATGVMTILHGSLTEYLIIFGSAVGTEAYSGRYRVDIHDFVMAGEMWTYTEDHCADKIVTRPGERALLPRGAAKGWRILEGTWMLEYGRGLVASTLPVALGDALLSAQDVRTVLKTMRIYGKLVARELLRGKL